MKTIVVGSGLAGLTAAAYLVQAGHQVTVYEQYSEIGGVTATLRQGGFGWDLGPLLLEGMGPGEPAGEVLAELGVANQVPLAREDRGLSFPDFELWKPETYQGPYWRRERLKDLFPEDSQGLDGYYQFYDRMMDLVALSRRADRARGIEALLLKARLLVAFNRVRAMQDWNAEQLLDHFFQRKELQAVYAAILADFVVRPSQFQGLGIPLVNAETAYDKRIPRDASKAGLRSGFYYVLGGCGALVAALAGAVRASGGIFHTGAAVRQVTIQEGRATGVTLDGGHHEPADLVLVSGGAREAFLKLIGRAHLPAGFVDDVENMPLMESVLMAHVGIDFDPAPYQRSALCYYYGTYDIEKGVDHCQHGQYHEGKDGFLIYVPSMHSPELAPPDHHAVTVYTIAPNHLSQGTWAERREELGEKLLIEAEQIVPELRARSQVRVTLTPEDFRARTGQEHHSFGGAAPVMGKVAPPHRTPVKGLWFIGSQSDSGAGVAPVIAGTRKAVVQQILQGD